ncbi:hypothetical protein [Actinoplanes sp. NPDC023714]|uniref:hypothetical protein n=1 Tax=Actinoplanes sp. NPDC023714 TaxID=3154322 RepID=UPI00340E3384
MMRFRFVPAVVLCVCAAALAACGEEPSSPAPASSAAPASTAAPAAGAAPASSAASDAGPDAAGGAAGTIAEDKALCRELNTAAKDLRTGITEAQQDGGGVKAADAKRTFTAFTRTVTEAVASAPDSAVVAAAAAIADELGAAAAAADPIGTAADSDFAKLGNDLTAACKTAGVEIMF